MYCSCFPSLKPFYYVDVLQNITDKAKNELKRQEKRKILLDFLNKQQKRKK